MIRSADPPPWLETCWILSAFAPTEADAVGQYVRFVAAGEGQPSPWGQRTQQVFLGSDVFVETMRRKVPADGDPREIPQGRARPSARPLAHSAEKYPGGDRAIAAASASGGYTMREAGDHFGLHCSRVSKIV
jgi:hypothetical protein